MSAIPPTIRNILDSGKGEIRLLEQQYRIWYLTTLLTGFMGFLLLLGSLLLALVEIQDDILFVRIIIGLAFGIDLFVFYIVFQETLSRRRYLLEVERLMMSGMTFIDSIRRGFRDFFG